jgi:3',5'-cyclic AMP phosphodiesterase CpdA
MRIAQITDLHLDDFLAQHYQVDTRGNFAAVLADGTRRGITDVVLTGDLGEFSSQSWLVETLRLSRVHPLLILGNHDAVDDFRALSLTSPDCRPDGLYYSRNLGGMSCLFLDSSAGTVGQVQLGWVEAQLAESSGPVAVFVHHPLLDCGSTADRLYALTNRDSVRDVLAASGREIAVFCGHYHFADGDVRTYERITQYVTPSTLVQFGRTGETVTLDTKAIGYRIVELSSSGVTTEVVTLEPV